MDNFAYITMDDYHELLARNEVIPDLTYYIVDIVPQYNYPVDSPKLERLSFNFDGTDFSDLMWIERIERPYAASTTNHLIENSRMNGGIFIGSKREPMFITIHFSYVQQNLNAIRRVLGRLLVNEYLGHLMFSDEPGIFYLAKIDGAIDLEEGRRHARGSMTFIVPDSVGYSVEHIRKTFSNTDFVMLENNGTDYAYPTYDFTIKSTTYMIALSTSEATFQFGEALEQAPDKTITYKITEQPGYVPLRKRQVVISDDMNVALPSKWSYQDISLIRPEWYSTGATYRVLRTTATGQVNGTVKVAMHALLWQTGEKISDWVKGRTFVTDAVKNVNQSRSTKAYRLKDGSVYLGWLLEQDIENQGEHNKGGLEALYGNPIDSRRWHGPSIIKDIQGKATDWQLDYRSSFKLSKHSEYGMQYVAVLDGVDPIFSFEVSADRTNRTARVYLTAGGKGIRFNQDPNNTFFQDFEGLITVNYIDDQLTLEIRNTINNKMISQSWTVPDMRGRAPTKLAFYTSRYPNKPVPEKNYLYYTKFTGFNAEVWVDPNATIDINEVDPRYVFEAGDQISLTMKDNKAFVNGLEMLNPIAHGSKSARIPPGLHEVIITADSVGEKPSLEVNYREEYK